MSDTTNHNQRHSDKVLPIALKTSTKCNVEEEKVILGKAVIVPSEVDGTD